jgi:hypothetical protein
MAALFSFFKPFLLSFWGSFGGDLVKGRFFKIQLHCGFDQVRMCLFLCSTFLCIQNSLILHVLPVSIVGVDAKIVNLVTPIRQPIHGPNPLIGRTSTSSIGFYFSSSPNRRSPSLPFWMNPEEILVFQYSVDEEDVQQFVKDLF